MTRIGKPATCTASRLGAQTELGLEITGGTGTMGGLISRETAILGTLVARVPGGVRRPGPPSTTTPGFHGVLLR